MGSKSRFAKELLPIILKDREPCQWYVEPFVGGCNMIDKVDGHRIGSDANKYLIAMWKGLKQDLKRPLEISRDLHAEARAEYNNRKSDKFTDFEIGWIGFMASFNGRFFGGGYSGKHKDRDYVNEQIKNTTKQIPLIKTIDFYHCEYQDLDIPSESIIYCDIPYKGTKVYDTKIVFDYDKFWDWCRKMSKDGHKIFVSEYEAPIDFICLWEKKVNVSIRPTKTLHKTEKLFTI
jgi:DNA adenine methylase